MVVHRVIDFPITHAVFSHCRRDLSLWKHLPIAVIFHAHEKLSTVEVSLMAEIALDVVYCFHTCNTY
ncbi:hypothetical protein DPMN_173406 [Dreissena polymorpha]|uniref:Uncharacterized protein n=1 Tax=Dreissena polymorpha TaxID=45954 RepID=A0A9D4IGX0_DREPO|nr:hypothetical protein DPMN_173406 [Dreissena polymorpha]